jgi:hypothetical protein
LETQAINFPLLLASRCRAGPVPAGNALGQIFVEVVDAALGGERIHVQIYGYNPFVGDLISARLRDLVPRGLLQPFFDRMMVAIAYLPGALSGHIRVRVTPARGGELPAATYTGVANPRSRLAARAIERTFSRHAASLRISPLWALKEISEPGASIHLAAALPMRHAPGPGETDRLGRPFGSQRTYVIDSACFTTMPSEHLTLTIMANAARIAVTAAQGATV